MYKICRFSAIVLVVLGLAALIARVSLPAHGTSLTRVSTGGPAFTDRFGDGTPDFLRLESDADQQAFRQWFTLIAEMQAERQQEHKLPAEINDCAALLRYSFHEALREHRPEWVHANGLDALALPASISKYQFPRTATGANVFRVHGGAFRPSDLEDGTFAEFADAEGMRRFNTFFVSRDLRQARPGDLLFFRQGGQTSPYHSMIFVGSSVLAGTSGTHEPLVVYHTGPVGKSAGEVRRLLVSDLLRHPDARWRPVPQNPNFLGVYRWNILRED